MTFDPNVDKIAIAIPRFTLHKHADGIRKYNEPYILSVAVDSHGLATPNIDFNFMSFPKIGRGGTVSMLGDGHIVYGPRQPGEFVAVSVVIMESDSDIRDVGTAAQSAVTSKAADLAMNSMLSARPGASGVLSMLKELIQLVVGSLKENKDDELFRCEGGFLRDITPAYHINRSHELGNDYISLALNVIPLRKHNQQGALPKSIAI